QPQIPNSCAVLSLTQNPPTADHHIPPINSHILPVPAECKIKNVEDSLRRVKCKIGHSAAHSAASRKAVAADQSVTKDKYQASIHAAYIAGSASIPLAGSQFTQPDWKSHVLPPGTFFPCLYKSVASTKG